MKKESKTKKLKKTTTGLIVACSILGGTTLALGTLLYMQNNKVNDYSMRLENIYQKSYYDFADNINNAETKLSKAISTDDSNYARKLLQEVSKNASDAEDKLNSLPVSANGLEESLTFINQVGGYSETLSKKLANGGSLSQNDKQTLRKLQSSLIDMKTRIADMTDEMKGGYGILNNSLSLEGDYNNLTISLQGMKADEVDYPSMIYDGPFSDSQIDKKVVGLTGEKQSMQQAREKLSKLVKLAEEEIDFVNETNSKFQTYDFKFEKNQMQYFAQMTKTGANLITMSTYNDNKSTSLSKQDAIKIATEFISLCGVESAECVWSDVVGGNAYLNFAPLQNGVILYPDLIKVKVDLAGGAILGYEATGYYTNHTQRNLENFSVSEQNAKAKIGSEYKILSTRKVLAPIEYSEVLCYEMACVNQGSEYYFYVDSNSGQMVNVLKVIKTNDGSKLM